MDKIQLGWKWLQVQIKQNGQWSYTYKKFAPMKYEKEIDQLLRDLIYEDWMSEEDYNIVISEIFENLGINKEKLNDDLEIGLKNGYSIEDQFRLIGRVLNDNS